MDKSWEPQKRKKRAGGRKNEPKENWMEGIQRSRKDRKEKEVGREGQGREKGREKSLKQPQISVKYV